MRWTDQERKAFLKSLWESGIKDDYELVAAYCESKGAPRPSVMTIDQRNAFLRALATPAKPGQDSALFRYNEWAAVHGPGILAEIGERK